MDAYKGEPEDNTDRLGDAHKSSSNNEILCLCHPSVLRLDMPLSFSGPELRTSHDRFEGAVLFDIENPVDMVKVSPELFVIRIVGRPCPILVDLGPRELILGHLRVNSGSGIAIPAPGSAEIGAGFVDYSTKAMLAKGFETEDTT